MASNRRTHTAMPFYRIIFACCLLSFLFAFCQKEEFTTSKGDKLEFSTDTLHIDTVFTQLGSATRILKLYNRHNKSIRVSKIYLENGSQSHFRINVDGLPGNVHSDLEIAPNDSMYVFVAVTVDPDLPPSASPFVINDNLMCETNGNIQKVVLEAWGQNAVYLPSRFGKGGVVEFSCNGDEWVWDDPRPYVIYGILYVDNCTVRIPAGKRIYVHGGLGRQEIDGQILRYNDGFLAFTGSGKLLIEGTKDHPVIIESDRLEPEFKDDPGQWTGIWLQAGTNGHRIDHCIVRNSIIGIRIDSAADLTIRNSQIYNTAGSGIIGIHAKIDAENCLLYRNNGFSIQLEYGGDYNFTFCTAASFGVDGAALRMTNVLCLDDFCETYRENKLKARFTNCILTGSRADQIELYNRSGSPGSLDYQFENCLVKVDRLLDPKDTPDFFTYCQPCIDLEFADKVFTDINEDDFRPDSLDSKASGYARPIPGIQTDLFVQPRDPIAPDAGAIERQ